MKEQLQRVRTPNKVPRLVVAPSYVKGAFDSHAVDCPSLFSHGGRHYMSFVGWDTIGYRTGLAVSDDLLNWTKEGLILGRGPAGSPTEFNAAMTGVLRDNALFGSGAAKKVGGRFVGTYHAYPQPGYETGPAIIGLCFSDDLRKWEVSPPVLTPGKPGGWDSGGLYKSWIMEDAGTYYLFYNAKTDAGWPWREQTGVAISTDLQRWEKYAGNPILPVGGPGSIDEVFASDPVVVRDGDTWVMFYYTLDAKAVARDTVAFSKDLLHWEKSNEVLIDVGPPGSIDSRYAHKPGIASAGGRLYHYYCALAPAANPKMGQIEHGEVRGISVATS
ncbi:MAG: hypothetical protein ABFD92_13815 [Planctomycetaceae bacterium]|nr:hypothetical protein [Planctomycetaceae bacterium]